MVVLLLNLSLQMKEQEISFEEVANILIKAIEEEQVEFTKEYENIDWDRVSQITERNIKLLKDIINQIGWPNRKKVGTKAANSAWIIVQHADSDPDFQNECLTLMKKEGDSVAKSEIAYLTDRVLVAKGKKQLYGTQFRENKKGLFLWSLENPRKLEELRMEMELEPFKEYLKMHCEFHNLKLEDVDLSALKE